MSVRAIVRGARPDPLPRFRPLKNVLCCIQMDAGLIGLEAGKRHVTLDDGYKYGSITLGFNSNLNSSVIVAS